MRSMKEIEKSKGTNNLEESVIRQSGNNMISRETASKKEFVSLIEIVMTHF